MQNYNQFGTLANFVTHNSPQRALGRCEKMAGGIANKKKRRMVIAARWVALDVLDFALGFLALKLALFLLTLFLLDLLLALFHHHLR